MKSNLDVVAGSSKVSMILQTGLLVKGFDVQETDYLKSSKH